MHVGIAKPRWGRGDAPGIPGACATHNFTYLVRGPLILSVVSTERQLYCQHMGAESLDTVTQCFWVWQLWPKTHHYIYVRNPLTILPTRNLCISLYIPGFECYPQIDIHGLFLTHNAKIGWIQWLKASAFIVRKNGMWYLTTSHSGIVLLDYRTGAALKAIRLHQLRVSICRILWHPLRCWLVAMVKQYKLSTNINDWILHVLLTNLQQTPEHSEFLSGAPVKITQIWYWTHIQFRHAHV